jgi:hypothetical protein
LFWAVAHGFFFKNNDERWTNGDKINIKLKGRGLWNNVAQHHRFR